MCIRMSFRVALIWTDVINLQTDSNLGEENRQTENINKYYVHLYIQLCLGVFLSIYDY